MTDTIHPDVIQPDEPLPNRKVIRSWLEPMRGRRILGAVALLIFDWVFFSALIAVTVLAEAWWLKLIAGAAAGIVIGRLFIIGHDACHMSYTPSVPLNKVLGRIAMLPSLTPYALWQVGHNVVHHGYTNLKGVDFVWEPLTKEEFDALPPWRQRLERLYRSGWGPWLYYLIEIWWLREYFPSKEYMGTKRPEFFWDSALVTVAAAAWISGLVFGALATDQSVWLLVVCGFIVPFIVWNGLIGFVVYVHHTHPKVIWHDDKREWARSAPFVSTTVHLIFPMRLGGFFHHIMEHTAHHVDMAIPLYKLKEAQQKLEDTLPGRITVQKFSWRWYFDTARRCKLYDFERQCWTDFDGQVV